jgi:hypothetical protein
VSEYQGAKQININFNSKLIINPTSLRELDVLRPLAEAARNN